MNQVSQAIYDVLLDVYQQSPWSLEQIQRDLDQDNTDYFLEYEGEQLVGFLSIQNLVGELEITNIAVRQSCQGQGVAKKLMTNLDDRQETIFLEVRESNGKARRLYQQFGFTEVGRRKDYYRQPLEDAIVMQRGGYGR